MNHSQDQYANGATHANTAESFNAPLERAKFGDFHGVSRKRLHRTMREIGFRWYHREPKEHVTKTEKQIIIMIRLPVKVMLASRCCIPLPGQISWQRGK
jgi:hypothetical protein